MDVVEQPELRPCHGHFSGTYFSGYCYTGFDNTTFVGTDDTVYKVIGQHSLREGEFYMCIEDIFTQELWDVELGEFNLAVRESWTILNEMGVLAWVTK